MYKIRRVSFVNHPVLKNLSLDFCDVNGNAVDTVFFAGENGNGKSTILNELYKAASHSVNYDQVIEYEHEKNIFTITYTNKVMSEKTVHMWANDGKGMNTLIVSLDIRNRYPFSGVFSDVDINFNSEHIRTVTSLNLDSNKVSCRSTNDLSINIKQLLVDVQSLDDAEIANEVRKNNS